MGMTDGKHEQRIGGEPEGNDKGDKRGGKRTDVIEEG